MLEIILVQGFCPGKIEITQFPNGFHLTPAIAFIHFLLGAGEGVLAVRGMSSLLSFLFFFFSFFFCCFLKLITNNRCVLQDDDNEGIQVSNEMANRMSLFYAYPTPILKILSDATSKFVTEV